MQNAWINRYRKKCRRPPDVLVGGFTESSTSSQAPRVPRSLSAEGAVLERIPDDRVRNALMKLPENFRVAVHYADIEGFRSKEIAHVTGTSLGTVMSRIHRGRQQPRTSLVAPAAE
jgi:RNA polymerase sigma-70 factor (ECF subfamily)